MINLLLISLMSLSNATETEELSVQDESLIENIEMGLIEDSEDDLEVKDTSGTYSELGAYSFSGEDDLNASEE